MHLLSTYTIYWDYLPIFHSFVNIMLQVYFVGFFRKVCQWLATGRWFSLGTPVSSTNKYNIIAEILLKVALKRINPKLDPPVAAEGRCPGWSIHSSFLLFRYIYNELLYLFSFSMISSSLGVKHQLINKCILFLIKSTIKVYKLICYLQCYLKYIVHVPNN